MTRDGDCRSSGGSESALPLYIETTSIGSRRNREIVDGGLRDGGGGESAETWRIEVGRYCLIGSRSVVKRGSRSRGECTYSE